ncbi:MAG: dipeptidase [Solirubrobacterales bacterium]|nr:dipeptidase [Solirubrobacterales bacterium]
MSKELQSRISDLMPRAKSDLSELVAFRSVASTDVEPAEECEKAAEWVADAFSAAGAIEVTANVTPDGSKAITGRFAGPEGAPTVLLYSHYDVQPGLDPALWQSPPFELTERDGRWYGRGAADCKSNTIAILTALRALGSECGAELPINVKFVVEGSEEQGTGGLDQFVEANPEVLESDAILICDTGNFELGRPTLTSSLRGIANVVVNVKTLAGAQHSGVYGGSAPDALTALIHMLAGLTDANGNTTIAGLDSTQGWDGVEYPPEQFAKDAGVLDGVTLAGDGSVPEMVWARPVATVLGIDAPSVATAGNVVSAEASAKVSVRVPPGMTGIDARDALTKQLMDSAPWGAKVTVTAEAVADPFSAAHGGPAYDALVAAMEESYDREVVTHGQGGSIPLCTLLQELYPEAEIMLLGTQEPLCQIHAPDESVDPFEVEKIALALALFIQRFSAPSK